MVVAVVLFFLPAIYYIIRKQYAKHKVAGRGREEKTAQLNADLEPFGFVYDEQQDMIYSGMYPWQRELGYCRLYDEAALALNMAIQCEPIYFRHNNRRWLIEFWKGQYGMTTGGEVGIYVTDKEDISIPGVFEGPFFECVSDEERIQMEYVLYRKGRPVLWRKGYHWWLTGFEVGKFTNPRRLSMEIGLTFQNRAMLLAFAKGLREAGYKPEEYGIAGNTVHIRFTEPKTKQPSGRVGFWVVMVQLLNLIYCRIFRRVTKDFVRVSDKLDYLRFLFPRMYRTLIGFGTSKIMRTAFEMIKEKVEESREVGK